MRKRNKTSKEKIKEKTSQEGKNWKERKKLLSRERKKMKRGKMREKNILTGKRKKL